MHIAAAQHKHRRTPGPDRWTLVLAMVYLLVVVWVLLFKLGVRFSYMDERRVNLVPFEPVFSGQGRLDLAEIILNVLIFVPLGLYTAILLRRWSMGRRLVFVILCSVLFEVLQYVMRIGSFDVTDIVNNSFGGVIGLMLFGIIERLSAHPIRAHRIVNILATIGTVSVVGLLILLKLNMLPIRYQ